MKTQIQNPNAENALRRYLDELRTALRSAPAAEQAEALRDAEELLRDELDAIPNDEQVMSSTVLAHLKSRCGTPDEMASGIAGVEQTQQRSKWRPGARQLLVTLAGLTAVLLLAGGIAYAIFREPPELSPFTQVDFKDEQVLVTYNDRTYEWLAIDGIPIEKIRRSAMDEFGDRWQKRIAEDLVWVLWEMNHSPSRTVSLRLRDQISGEEKTVSDASMTHAKREQVLDYRHKLERRQRERLRAEAAKDPVAFVRNTLQERWAYYWHDPAKIDAYLDHLASHLESDVGVIDWPLELQKIVSLGIDGHASSREFRMRGQKLPFLIEPIGDFFVAFNEKRSRFLDEEFSRITAIDGVPIADWCEATTEVVPVGSPQYVRRHALRNLRHINHWRRQLGKEITPTIEVKLASLDGNQTKTITLKTTDDFPKNGTWPRTKSRFLEESIGYVRISAMDDDAPQELKHWMGKFKNTRGLVVDVRGNGGGSRDTLRTMASYLMEDNTSPWVANVGKYILNPEFSTRHLDARYMYPEDSKHWSDSQRHAIREFATNFKPEWEPPAERFSQWNYMVLSRTDDAEIYHYDKPIVILMDAKCFSATDIFLGALKNCPSVTLMGTPSSGGSARALTAELPSLANIRIASMASFQPTGKLYDTNGIQPDVLVRPKPEYFIGGEDNVLAAAVAKLSK